MKHKLRPFQVFQQGPNSFYYECPGYSKIYCTFHGPFKPEEERSCKVDLNVPASSFKEIFIKEYNKMNTDTEKLTESQLKPELERR